jgi:hypothetical protein
MRQFRTSGSVEGVMGDHQFLLQRLGVGDLEGAPWVRASPRAGSAAAAITAAPPMRKLRRDGSAWARALCLATLALLRKPLCRPVNTAPRVPRVRDLSLCSRSRLVLGALNQADRLPRSPHGATGEMTSEKWPPPDAVVSARTRHSGRGAPNRDQRRVSKSRLP